MTTPKAVKTVQPIARRHAKRSRDEEDEDEYEDENEIRVEKAKKQKLDEKILLRKNLYEDSIANPALAKCGGDCGWDKSGREFRLIVSNNTFFTRFSMANSRETIVAQLQTGIDRGFAKGSVGRYDLLKYIEHPVRSVPNINVGVDVKIVDKLVWEPYTEEEEGVFRCRDCAKEEEGKADSEKYTLTEVQKNSPGPQHELRSVHDLRLGYYEQAANSLLQQSSPEHSEMKRAIFENVALSKAEKVVFTLSGRGGEWCTTDPDVKSIPGPSLINIADRSICVIIGKKAVINTAMVKAALYTITGKQYLEQQQAELAFQKSIRPMSEDEGEFDAFFYLCIIIIISFNLFCFVSVFLYIHYRRRHGQWTRRQ